MEHVRSGMEELGLVGPFCVTGLVTRAARGARTKSGGVLLAWIAEQLARDTIAKNSDDTTCCGNEVQPGLHGLRWQVPRNVNRCECEVRKQLRWCHEEARQSMSPHRGFKAPNFSFAKHGDSSELQALFNSWCMTFLAHSHDTA